jgi:tetratricopeptide (TPR) repeat protein/TolB-like protein
LPPADARKQRFSRTYLSVIGALGIAAIGVFAYDRMVGLPSPDVAPTTPQEPALELPPILPNSIGVLPFLALDPSERTRIFSNGIAEDLINSLARVPGLLVASRGDAFTLSPNTPSARIRDRLRVAMYIEGSVQIERDLMRVVVQLVDSETGFHILSRDIDREVGDYFSLRDEIAELAIANVRVALPPETREIPTTTAADPDIDVYVLYRRGIEASRQADPDTWVNEALQWFDAALEIDPDYAAAYAGKCDVYVKAYPFGYEASHIESAEAACATALRLNPNLDVVYASLGDLRTATGEYETAERAYLDALAIDPNNASALTGLGRVYRIQDRPQEAEASIRRAIGLHPGDWSTYNALGLFLFRSGRYAEAAEQFRITVSLDESNVQGHTNLASALMLAGSFDAAEPVFRRAIDLEPNESAYTNLGMLLYYSGRFDEAVSAHRKAVEIQQQDYLARSNLGDALWAAGMKDEALAVFRTAKALALTALEVNPNDPFILMDLAWIHTALGEGNQAAGLIDRALTAVPNDPYVHYLHALILNRSDDIDGALAAIDAAIEHGYSTQLLASDPNLANLRRDSRFSALIALSK